MRLACNYGIVVNSEVVLSFLVAAISRTAASIFATILAARLHDHKPFFPIKLLFRMRDSVPPPACRRGDHWQRTLDRLILSLADLQLITGFALLIAGYAIFLKGITPQDWHNAHWTVIVYMSYLSSSTHLATVLTLTKYFDDHKKISVLRICLILIFSALLRIALSTSRSFSVFLLLFRLILAKQDIELKSKYVVPLAVFWILPVMYVFYIAIRKMLPRKRDGFKAWLSKRAWAIVRKRLEL